MKSDKIQQLEKQYADNIAVEKSKEWINDALELKLQHAALLANEDRQRETRIIALQCATNGAFTYIDEASFDNLLKHFENYVKYGLGEIQPQAAR